MAHERAERELEELKAELEQRETDVKEQGAELAASEAAMARMEHNLRGQEAWEPLLSLMPCPH